MKDVMKWEEKDKDNKRKTIMVLYFSICFTIIEQLLHTSRKKKS